MNTSTTQLLLVRPSNPSSTQFLQGAAKTLRRLGRAWKRSLPTIEFGRSAAAARGYRRAALLAARRGDRQAACRLEAAVRAVGGGQ